MSVSTEIYICEPDQPVEQGKLEYSDTIHSRADAEKDALSRCAAEPYIGKLVYYAVSDDGGFRTLFTYYNPNAKKLRKKRAPAGAMTRDLSRSTARPKRKQRGLIDRLLSVFEED